MFYGVIEWKINDLKGTVLHFYVGSWDFEEHFFEEDAERMLRLEDFEL